MKNNKTIWFLRGVKSLFFIVILLSISLSSAYGAVYYIAPDGSDKNNGSSDSPWATFAHAMTALTAGDTLIIKDGTYKQSLNVTVSGTSSAYITIQAENEGSVIIDGEGVRIPCEISSQSYINLQGFTCANSSGSVVDIGNSSYINLYRIFAHDAADGGNYNVFEISYSNNVLLEDCAGWGIGRKIYLAYETEYVTFRRCYARWKDYTIGTAQGVIISIYGSDNTIVENCVFTTEPTTKISKGISVWANTYNDSANNNKIYGNVIYDVTSGYGIILSSAKYNIYGNKIVNNVLLNTKYGLRQAADSTLTVSALTIVDTYSSGVTVYTVPGNPYNSDFEVYGTLKNTAIISSGGYGIYLDANSDGSPILFNNFNSLYNNSSGNYGGNANAGSYDVYISPNYDTTTYGKGAYLMVPDTLKGRGENGEDIGAEILYQYVNGELTSNRLWPWPMEDRICAETGYSVTYENGCVYGGGIWKTLDGVYPLTMQADLSPPNPPTGLKVN